MRSLSIVLILAAPAAAQVRFRALPAAPRMPLAPLASPTLAARSLPAPVRTLPALPTLSPLGAAVFRYPYQVWEHAKQAADRLQAELDYWQDDRLVGIGVEKDGDAYALVAYRLGRTLETRIPRRFESYRVILRTSGPNSAEARAGVKAGKAFAKSSKGRPWSQTEYNMSHYYALESLRERGASEAHIAAWDKAQSLAPIRGGSFNPYSGD